MQIIVNIKSVIVNHKISKQILQENKFTLDENRIYTITGKNGAGKSTLLNTIIGNFDTKVYSVDGSVIFNKTDILQLNDTERRKFRKSFIRFVPQDAIGSFDPLKKLKYYFSDFTDQPEKIKSLFQYFELSKVEKILNLYPYEISGGMAQRLSIILALLSDPEIIILDEPNSALDIPTSNLVSYKLKEFINLPNKTILLVTQDIKFANVTSNFIANMQSGSVNNFVRAENFYY